MKHWLTAIMMVMALGTAHAGQLSFSGSLTPEQQAQLELQAVQQAAANEKGPITAQRATEWVEFGSAIGQGLAGTAKELGVAADEIADTKVGLYAMILIAWHYVGEDLVGIVFGFIWLLLMIPTWVYMYKRVFAYASITTYEKGKREDGKRKIVAFKDHSEISEAMIFMAWISLVLICAVGILPIVI